MTSNFLSYVARTAHEYAILAFLSKFHNSTIELSTASEIQHSHVRPCLDITLSIAWKIPMAVQVLKNIFRKIEPQFYAGLNQKFLLSLVLLLVSVNKRGCVKYLR